MWAAARELKTQAVRLFCDHLTDGNGRGIISVDTVKRRTIMSTVRKYVYPTLHYAAVFLFGFIPFEVFSLVLRTLYEYLKYELPSIVPDYSPVLDPQNYARVVEAIDMIAILLSIIVITYIAMRMDNTRFEHTVVPTSGLYRIPEALRTHLREFAVSDIIVSVLVPTVFVVAAYLVPEVVLRWGGNVILWAGVKAAKHLELFDGVFRLSITSVIARLILTPKVLIDWRASWLTASVG